MNLELGSVMGHFHKLFPVTVYELEVPQNFEIPSMYFPEPNMIGGNDTTSTYLKTYTMSVKLFHKDSQQAFHQAEAIADAIMEERNIIPMLDEDGVVTGDYIRFTKVEARKVDSGVALIALTWDSRYHYKRETAPAIQNIEFQSGVKS